MPPATIAATSVGSLNGDVLTFAMPLRAQEGDQLIACIMTDAGAVTTLELDGGEDNASMFWPSGIYDWAPGTHADIFVPRWLYSGDLGSTLTLRFSDGVPTWCLAVLLCVRGTPAVDPVAFLMQRTNVTASTSFSSPSITLTEFSDLYIGIVAVTTAATDVTPPAGATEVIETQSGGRTLAVYSIRPEATGATGAKVATTAGAQSGSAASIAYHAEMTVPAAELKTNAPGAIGFVDIGV